MNQPTKKAFFINGGAGRVLCAIPALEKFAKTNDNFIIVSEAWPECFSGNEVLQDKVFFVQHKNLFEDYLKDCELISPEPYRVNQYFNQKCNLIQAFDILINGTADQIVDQKITLDLSKKEQITGYNIVDEVKTVKQKEKVLVFQPFGSTAQMQGKFIFDSSGRSFELSDIYKLLESLTKNYAVIVMSPIDIPSTKDLGIAHPKNLDLRTWMGIINAADGFLGCDSVGQHIAYALDKPAVVVIGATFPENISYPNSSKFTIIDNGKENRKYSPIRITVDEAGDRVNENLMILSNETLSNIISSVEQQLTPNKSTKSITLPKNPMLPNSKIKK
jgi:hypothetical protein